MRRILIVVLAVALTLSLVVFIAGCGGNKDKDTAKQYMTDGDASWQLAQDQWKKVTDMQTQITTTLMSGDLSQLQGAVGTALTKQFTDGFAAVDQNNQAAKQQYDSISSLNDVQDYKDYASQMLQAIDLDQQRVMAFEALIQSITSYIQSLPAGQQPNLQQLASNPDYQRVTDLEMQIQNIEKSADQLRKDKKL